MRLGTIIDTISANESASVERVGRRGFLVRLGGATASVTVVGAFVGNLIGCGRAPDGARDAGPVGARDAEPREDASVGPVPGTRPELTPVAEHYRTNISAPPVIDGASWRLRVSGLVERPQELTIEQLRAYEPLEKFITLACISNPVAGNLIGTQRWTGVSLQRLLPDLGLQPGASHLKLSSADGFFETLALDTVARDERAMLAYAWDGVPLPAEHGFPLRLYVPNLYGMKQPKWIESIEVMDHDEEGFWVVRSWDREATMKATSVIDAVAVDARRTDAGGRTLVPVGGIAHAGARGISSVELRVDDGEWLPAQLFTPLSELTWVVWRYDMPFEVGDHTLTVRCYDGAGQQQIASRSPPYPDGASGLHSRDVSFE